MAAEDVKKKRAKEKYSDKRSEKRNNGLIDHLGKGIKIKTKINNFYHFYIQD